MIINILIATILLGITIFLICIFSFNTKETLIDEHYKKIHDILYSLLEKTISLFKKHDIKYFIHSGSLLGAVRENGIIPHDDDIDIGIFPESVEKLKSPKFQNDLKKLNLRITINKNNIHKIREINSKIFIDIFVFRENENKIEYDSDYCNKNWPNGWFSKDDFFPLKKYVFGDMNVDGPVNPYPYLEQHFGNDWQIPKRTHSHHDKVKEEDI